MATFVRLDGRDLLVDVGYAAPFYDPLPLDQPAPKSFRFGRDAYVVHPRDAGGRTRLDLLRDGDRVHGYLLKPVPRTIACFRRVIRASYRDDATFMRSLLLVRFFDDQSRHDRQPPAHRLDPRCAAPCAGAVTRASWGRPTIVAGPAHIGGAPATIGPQGWRSAVSASSVGDEMHFMGKQPGADFDVGTRPEEDALGPRDEARDRQAAAECLQAAATAGDAETRRSLRRRAAALLAPRPRGGRRAPLT